MPHKNQKEYQRRWRNENPEHRTKGGKVIRLAVDHDHTTKQIRGLLCCDCNTALGLLRDSLDTIGALARYLREHTP